MIGPNGLHVCYVNGGKCMRVSISLYASLMCVHYTISGNDDGCVISLCLFFEKIEEGMEER